MRSLLKPAAGLACLSALAAAGCSSGFGGASDAAPKVPDRTAGTSYAPYVSATTASGNDSAGSPATYNLAFVISDGNGCTPQWDGMYALDDEEVRSRIARLRMKSGGALRVSFGGADGKELAAACEDVSALAGAYGRALDAAGSTRADFDIEGDELTDSASVALRSRAIARLQKERPGLEVTFTLPVMPSGLGAHGLALLESAHRHDVQVSTVNLMTMNYAESYTGDMGDYAIAAAEAAHTQLKKVFDLSDAAAWQGMALTSMIGVNDVAGETFTLSDAAQVRAFAEKKRIAWVSMWSAFRDQQCVKGSSSRGDAATDCSGVTQKPGAFGKAFGG
ncbi:hydrolase [Streptomyces sp. NTH33]|uniref:chitinase n=1 Tax=Streptomyces sp. NTH33 TaxID=1735453 RepID=UPI000DA80424|nr:chitinase [Streptomyces sp. NTH33]PZH16217.1 hydrolase [Streptomyces sp. NTH33]